MSSQLAYEAFTAVAIMDRTPRTDLLVHRMTKAASDYRRKAERLVWLSAHSWA